MDILLALQERGIEWKRGTGENEIKICCVFCVERGESQDYFFRLGINTSKGLLHCFNCGYKSRSLKQLAYRLELGEIDNVVMPEKERKVDIRLPADYEPIKFNSNSLNEDMYWNRKAKQYLLGRGVSKEQIIRNKIGISLTGRYRYRIIFPVFARHKLQGFTTRAFVPKIEPRYLNTPGLKALYNAPRRKKKHRGHKELVLSEGVFKCFKIENFALWRFGSSAALDSCALLGHDLTEYQEDTIERCGWKTITLWPDPDPVGADGFIRIADKLSTKYRVKIPWPVPKQQADDMSFDDIGESFDNRIDFNEGMVLEWQNEIMLKER